MEPVRCEQYIQGNSQYLYPTTTKACLDTYIDPDTGRCVASCGVARYGSAAYSWRSLVETSQCYDCHGSCYECIGPGQDECSSCKAGYYLLN